jgi:hypothetical protein
VMTWSNHTGPTLPGRSFVSQNISAPVSCHPHAISREANQVGGVVGRLYTSPLLLRYSP